MGETIITVREAHASEYQRIGEITLAAYLALGDDMADEDRAFYLDELRDVKKRAQSCEILVAVDGRDNVLGAVAFVPDGKGEMAEWETPDAAGFRMLAVAPEAQGLGCGRSLTIACIDRAKALGRSELMLHSTAPMTVAQRMYEKLGFERFEAIDIDLGHTLLMGYRMGL